MPQKDPLPEFIPDQAVPAVGAAGVELWIYSVFPKYQWKPHSAGDLVRPDHPGSAIRYEEKLYELMKIEEVPHGDYRFRYGLRSWGERNVIRHLVDYTVAMQRAEAAMRREERKTDRLRDGILWLLPLVGFAPDPLQRGWEKRTGLNMAWISAGSALFGMGLAFLLRGASKAQFFEVAILYLALESFARLFWIALTHQPHGSPLLTAPYLLWQSMFREEANSWAPKPPKGADNPADRTARATSFTLFWGVYPHRDQMQLQLLYGHNGPRSTAITAGIFLAGGLIEFCVAALIYRRPIIPLAAPAYLVAESLWRLYKAEACGEPAGSVLGYVLRPFIHPPQPRVGG